jgi:hypothetical protein
LEYSSCIFDEMVFNEPWIQLINATFEKW